MGARYSRQAGYTVSRRMARPTTRTVRRQIKFGPTTAKYFGLGLLTLLAIVMLTKSSNSALDAYQQNALRKQDSVVQQDISNLQLEAKRAQALQSVQNTPIKDQLQPAGQVDYVDKGQVAGVSTTAPSPSAKP